MNNVNDNHILFYFQNSYIISQNKISIFYTVLKVIVFRSVSDCSEATVKTDFFL